MIEHNGPFFFFWLAYQSDDIRRELVNKSSIIITK